MLSLWEKTNVLLRRLKFGWNWTSQVKPVTLCRFESVVGRRALCRLHRKTPPRSTDRINSTFSPRWATRDGSEREKAARFSPETKHQFCFVFKSLLFVLRLTSMSLFCWSGLPAAAVWLWRACIRCTPLPTGSGPLSAHFYGNETNKQWENGRPFGCGKPITLNSVHNVGYSYVISANSSFFLPSVLSQELVLELFQVLAEPLLLLSRLLELLHEFLPGRERGENVLNY